MAPKRKADASTPAEPPRRSARRKATAPTSAPADETSSDVEVPPVPKKARTTKAKNKNKDEAKGAPAPVKDVVGATASADATSSTKPKSNGKAVVADDKSDAEAPPVPKKARNTKAKDKDDDTVAANTASGDATSTKPKSGNGKAKVVVDTPKPVTIIKRGAAPVDPQSGFVDSHQVLEYGNEIWDAVLNQTDVANNANKFYVLQLLHPITNSSQCSLLVRWGRVGERGQQQMKGPWQPDAAVREFKKQFRTKAGIAWESRKGSRAGKGKYTYIERSFEDHDEDEEEEKIAAKLKSNGAEVTEKPPESKLAREVQALCKLIFSATIVEATLISMNYDANKLPLGKLAKSTILNGFSALKELASVLENPVNAAPYGGLQRACEELTNTYYSIIPHQFGRNRPVLINSMALLKNELELVDALGDMEIASKIISSKVNRDKDGHLLHPLDSSYRSLNLDYMDPVPSASKEFNALSTYALNSQGHTHAHYRFNLKYAFRVQRAQDVENFQKHSFDSVEDGTRLLLWHGSRCTNFAGILSQGLRIAPPEAPVTGYMFGKGVYFADIMTKSAGYCHTHLSDNSGLLLLCEVVAKPFYEQLNANYNAADECLKSQKRVTKGLGRTQPADWQDAGLALGNPELKGCYMPLGQPTVGQVPGASLEYNEYIAYDCAQIRMRYLLVFDFQ